MTSITRALWDEEEKQMEMIKKVADKVLSPASPTGTVFDKQVGGNHYKDMKIQPVDYIFANDLNFAEGCVVKYTTRSAYKRKAGELAGPKGAIEDLQKAIHYLEMQIELIKKDLK